MATLRTAGPSISSIFRLASQPVATSRCAKCLKAQRCPFSSSQTRRSSAKRPLMTESVHRPQTLHPDMPPPRNVGTPETSITGASQSPGQGWFAATSWSSAKQAAGVPVSEGEAQKSRPVTAAPSATATTRTTTEAEPTVKPRKSKLRPRKAPITLTPKAVEQLRNLFEQPEAKLIRVGVKNRGCSGLAYHLEYVDKPGAFDETVEQDGVKVLIDSKALFSIIGSEMDWLEDKLSARFIFKNPNITEQCGCGESFSIS